MPDLQSVVQRMIDAGESEDAIGSVIKAAKTNPELFTSSSSVRPLSNTETDNPVIAGIGGFGKGAVTGLKNAAIGFGGRIAHPLDTIGGIVGGLANEVVGTYHGIGNLASDPKQTLSDAGSAIMGMPGTIAQGVSDELDKGPAQVGQDIGGMTADTMAGIGLAGGLRILPKPAAISTGRFMQKAGGHTGFALRIMGAHQIGSGNPMGFVTMTLPESLKKGGEALERWATEPGALAATPESTFLQVQQDLVQAGQDPAVHARLSSQLDQMQADLVKQRQTAQLPGDLVSAQKAQNRLDQLRNKLVRATPDETFGGSPNPPMPPSGPTTPPPVRPIPGKVILPDPETAAPGYVPGGAVRPPIRIVGPEAGPVAPIAPSALVGPPEPSIAPSPVNPVKVSQEAAAKAFNDAMAAKAAPVPAIDQLLGERAAKVPLADAGVASKSRGAMSATPGLTVADAQALGINPSVKITGLAPDSIRKLLEDRADRAASHRINAGMDASANRASALDTAGKYHLQYQDPSTGELTHAGYFDTYEAATQKGLEKNRLKYWVTKENPPPQSANHALASPDEQNLADLDPSLWHLLRR